MFIFYYITIMHYIYIYLLMCYTGYIIYEFYLRLIKKQNINYWLLKRSIKSVKAKNLSIY